MRTLVIVLLLSCAALAQNASSAVPTKEAPLPECCPTQPTHEKLDVLWSKLKHTVDVEDRHLDGVMGVAILDLTDGRTLFVHPDDVFAQASTIKIAVLAELYHQAEEGKLKLNDLYTVQQKDNVPDSAIFNGLTYGVTQVTMRDLATMMIAVSDNSATNVLIDKVGMQNVNAMLQSQGLHQTKLQRKMMDTKAAEEGRENFSTPREMMTLLARIYEGKLLNKQMTADFFHMLATMKTSPIRLAIPDPVVSADKPGELDAVRNDCGVVFATNRPFAICVMTSYDRNERAAEDSIGRIAAAAYDMFDRVGRSSSEGRAMQPRPQ